MGKRRILPEELEIGSVLPWDAYDARGRLLLRKGDVVASNNQIEGLIARGLFALLDPEAVPQEPAAQLGSSAVLPILDARRRLEALCLGPYAPADFADQIRELRTLIAEACELSQDAALATALFEKQGRYSIRHSMDVAIACHIVGTALDMSEAELTSTVCAALTMNISTLNLQDVLQSQKERLSPEQQEVMHRHPEESVTMLRARGVTDPVWLEAVLSHHECLDGSGYRRRKKGTEISVPAQLVSLADVYCARISSRKYRKGLRPNAALRALFLDQGKKVSQDLAGRFIKAIGVLPAGTAVRLENGEIAVVLHRGESPNTPHVCSIVGTEGMPLVKPIARDTAHPTWKVKEVMEWADVGAMPSMHTLWGKLGAVTEG